MEIGHQGIDHMQRPARVNEDIGVAAEGFQLAIARRAFQRAHTGSAHRDHPPATGPASGDRIDHILADLQPLAMHEVIFDTLDPHRLKGAGAYMQGNESALDALFGDGREQRLIEMQPRGRRCHGAGAFGIYGLIALAVGGFVRPVDIGRQRHMAGSLQQRQHFFGKAQLEQRIVTSQHLGFAATVDQNRRAGLGRFTRTHMGQYPMAIQYALDQYFQLAAGSLLPEQPRRNHPGIVEHHQIARAQIFQQIAELTMGQLASGAVEHQQTAGTTLGEGMTGDKSVRQLEVKVGNAHGLGGVVLQGGKAYRKSCNLTTQVD